MLFILKRCLENSSTVFRNSFSIKSYLHFKFRFHVLCFLHDGHSVYLQPDFKHRDRSKKKKIQASRISRNQALSTRDQRISFMEKFLINWFIRSLLFPFVHFIFYHVNTANMWCEVYEDEKVQKLLHRTVHPEMVLYINYQESLKKSNTSFLTKTRDVKQNLLSNVPAADSHPNYFGMSPSYL